MFVSRAKISGELNPASSWTPSDAVRGGNYHHHQLQLERAGHASIQALGRGFKSTRSEATMEEDRGGRQEETEAERHSVHKLGREGNERGANTASMTAGSGAGREVTGELRRGGAGGGAARVGVGEAHGRPNQSPVGAAAKPAEASDDERGGRRNPGTAARAAQAGAAGAAEGHGSGAGEMGTGAATKEAEEEGSSRPVMPEADLEAVVRQ